MEAGCHYRTLGLLPGAQTAEIAASYGRALADFRARLGAGTPLPAEHLDRVRTAYRVLSDPDARRSYDAARKAPSTATAPTAARATADAVEEYPFAFTGSGGEYFRIWIVNLLLTVLTLGIYSAWAKVRRERYFHRNLMLNDSHFDYHGEASAILKGRIIAVILLVGLSVAETAGTMAYALALLGLALALPWLAVRALRFRAHNTSYRGLRFSFHGDYRGALIAFVGYGLLAVLTLGLLFPLFYRQQQKFVLDHLRYGGTQFRCEATIGGFYRIFVTPLLAAFTFFFALGMFAAIGGKAAAATAVGIGLLGYIVFLLLLIPYVRARTANLVWNASHLGAADFASTLTVWAYFRLYATNLVLMIVTLGLFWPWAKVRLARYRASCTALRIPHSLDDFLAGATLKASAIGDEMSEVFDVDVAL